MAKNILKYGGSWPAHYTPLEVEFACIRAFGSWEGKYGDKRGLGLPHHLKEAMRLLWPEPEMKWNRWMDLMIDAAFESPGRCGAFGPSSSSKSFVLSRAALTMFYARPHGTTVIISSTTLSALQRRIWNYVTDADRKARQLHQTLPGSMIESKLQLLADEATVEGRSFKNGVVGIACKIGNSFRGMADYIGLKNEVVIVVADELQFVPDGILDSIANLESNKMCYTIGMGNLPDVYNPLGKLCEPKYGWDSLQDVDKSRTYLTRWKNGRAVQLIGKDSPNFDVPEDEPEPFPFMIGREYIEQCRQNYGEDSDKFNMFAAGKIPRASMHRTAFTKAQCMKFHASDMVTWGHETVTRGYCLDAAYSGVGGDRTAGCPFIFGKDIKGMWRIWFGRVTIFPGSNTPKLSHSEAIALAVKQECEAADIPPEHVFYDGTGRSELTIAFARLWSAKVAPLEFGGPATERPLFTKERKFEGVTLGDVKTCRDAYANFVTELWFALSVGITSDQIRGMNEEAIEEGSQRKWEFMRGSKQQIEPKDKMKARGLRSPDIVDNLVCGVEGARRLGFPLGDTLAPDAKRRTNHWLDYQRDKEWENIKKEQLAA